MKDSNITFGNLDVYRHLNKTLVDFLGLFSSYICSRCTSQAITQLNLWNGLKPKSHHTGEINDCLISKKPILDKLDAYFGDIEHGIFHGIMTAFMAYYVNIIGNVLPDEEKTGELERIFADCLLHDFHKSIFNQQEGHDSALKDYFRLSDSAYHHESPDCLSHLVLADRLELARYEDYLEWVDDRYHSVLNRMSERDRNTILLFYKRIRPALKCLYESRDDIWIKHGLERTESSNYTGDNLFPPYNSHMHIWPFAGKEILIAIEHDSFPFKPNYENFAYSCATHGAAKVKWQKMRAFIPLKKYVESGGKIWHTKTRDHLFADSALPLSHWIFVHRDLGKDRAAEIGEILLSDAMGLISDDVMHHFGGLVKLLKERIIALNISAPQEEYFNHKTIYGT